MPEHRLCCSSLFHDTQAAMKQFIIFYSARRRHLIAHFSKTYVWTNTVRRELRDCTGRNMSHSITHMLLVWD